MANPRSVLTSVINELPDEFKLKVQSIPNFLKKKRVKEEEMEFSGMSEKLLAAGTDAKLNKQDLQAIEANRDDFFGNKDLGDTHGSVSLPGSKYPTTQVGRFRSAQDTTVQPQYDVTHGQIILPEGKDKLTLYSAAGATALAAGTQVDDAAADDILYTKDELDDNLAWMQSEEGLNLSESEARNMIIESLEDLSVELREEGYEEQEIRALMNEEYGDYMVKPDTSLLQGTIPGDGSFQLVDIRDKKSADNEVGAAILQTAKAAADNVTAEYMPMFGEGLAWATEDRQAQKNYDYRAKELAYSSANVLRNMGYNVSIDDNNNMIYTNEAGEQQEVTTSLWDEFQAAEVEAILGVGGVVAGSALLTKVPFGPAKALGYLGGIAGGIAGVVGGRGLDVAKNAWFTRQNLSNEFYDRKFQDTAVAAASFEIIGMGVIGMAKAGKKGVGMIYDMVIKGNKEGAYKALKEHMFINDEDIDELISLWEKSAEGNSVKTFLDINPDMDKRDLAMSVVAQTQPGAEAFVGASAQLYSRMGVAMRKSLDTRAKDLAKHTSALTNDNIGVVLGDELTKYKDSVQSFYGSIKDLGAAALKDSGYAFDYDKLAIKPLMEKMNKHITNPAVEERFLRLVQRMEQIGNPSGPRDFPALLDLRRAANGFKYNTKIKTAAGKDVVETLTNNLDAEIRKAAGQMDNGSAWLVEWRKANIEYSKMKRVENNVLYKALTKPGVTPKQVATALKGRIDSLDGTFMEVVSKLPPRVRAQAEGTVLDELTRKYTLGEAEGSQAVDFIALSDNLKHIGFSDSKARNIKRAVNQMAEVFRNDPNLFKATGGRVSSGAGGSNAFTADPAIRAKIALANEVFKNVKRRLPTAKGRELALIHRLGNILDNPRNAKQIDQLVKGLPEDPTLRDKLHKLAIQSAKFGEKEYFPKVEVYRTGIPGQMHKARDGKLGKGIYWTTGKKEAVKRGADTGAKLVTEKVLPGRVANRGDIESIFGSADIEALKESPKFKETLKDRGFDGITVDDQVLMFK